jgi:hypothetical protein
MDIGILFGTAAAILALIAVGKLTESAFGGAAELVGGLFNRASVLLGWPSGVQEDDSPWGWNEPADPSPASTEPEIVELGPPSG